jgi:hypothetical protein
MTQPQTTRYARPDGTRNALRNCIKVLQDIGTNIHMPGDFAVKARNLCVDMQNEVNREEPNA